MRVLQLLPHTAAVDGIQRAGLDLTHALATIGDRSVVLTLEEGDNFPAWMEATERIIVVPALHARWRDPAQLLRTLIRGLRSTDRADVVIVHRLDLLTVGALLALRFRAPLVLHAHNAPPDWFRWGDLLRTPGSRRAKRVIVASRYMEQVWRPRVPGNIPVSVVEYPIDPRYFALRSSAERRAAKSELGLDGGQVTLGFFGRLEPTKGLHVLAQAVGTLSGGTGGQPHVIVQGASTPGMSRSDTQKYRLTCDELLDGSVTWLPAGPDIRPALAACDIVAVPSVWAEPSGLVISEALCTGTPVVASDVGGIPEQLPRDSPFVRSVPPDDGLALARAISELSMNLPQDEDREVLRRHVIQRRSPDAIGSAYRAVLRNDGVAARAG